MSVEDAAQIFLSTPSARRATHIEHKPEIPVPISIHALREEGDTLLSKILPRLSIFLSTPSARRATLDPVDGWNPKRYFYPRPPRGGRRDHSYIINPDGLISIHALREEGDRS